MRIRFFKRGGWIFPFAFTRRFNAAGWQRIALFLFVLALLLLLFFTFSVKPVLFKLAEARAYNIGLLAINQTINNILAENSQEYSKLITLEKDQDGNVTALRSNITEINKLKSLLSTEISERILQIKSTDVNIPLGALLGSDLFSGRGPYIPVRLVPVSSVYVDFSDGFSAAGINQTMHEISLKIDANIGVLMPGMKTYVKVSTAVPISNTILLGKVPGSYTNIVGTTGTVQDNALQLKKDKEN